MHLSMQIFKCLLIHIYKYKMKKRINITIEDDVLKKFQDFCKKQGMKVSTRIELLIQKDIEK